MVYYSFVFITSDLKYLSIVFMGPKVQATLASLPTGISNTGMSSITTLDRILDVVMGTSVEDSASKENILLMLMMIMM